MRSTGLGHKRERIEEPSESRGESSRSATHSRQQQQAAQSNSRSKPKKAFLDDFYDEQDQEPVERDAKKPRNTYDKCPW